MNEEMRISKLKQLLDDGVLTQEEYDTKKGLILKQNEADAEQAEKREVSTPIDNISSEKADTEEASPYAFDNDLRSRRTSLVGKNAEHYIPIFEGLDQSGGKSWNWCVFFFSFIWFAYRKLYGWAVIAYLTPLIGGFACGMVLYSTSLDEAVINVIMRILGLAVNIVFAIVANGAYKKRIDKLVNEMPEDDVAKARFIETKGGVSIIAAIIMVALYIGEITLINL